MPLLDKAELAGGSKRKQYKGSGGSKFPYQMYKIDGKVVGRIVPLHSTDTDANNGRSMSLTVDTIKIPAKRTAEMEQNNKWPRTLYFSKDLLKGRPVRFDKDGELIIAYEEGNYVDEDGNVLDSNDKIVAEAGTWQDEVHKGDQFFDWLNQFLIDNARDKAMQERLYQAFKGKEGCFLKSKKLSDGIPYDLADFTQDRPYICWVPMEEDQYSAKEVEGGEEGVVYSKHQSGLEKAYLMEVNYHLVNNIFDLFNDDEELTEGFMQIQDGVDFYIHNKSDKKGAARYPVKARTRGSVISDVHPSTEKFFQDEFKQSKIEQLEKDQFGWEEARDNFLAHLGLGADGKPLDEGEVPTEKVKSEGSSRRGRRNRAAAEETTSETPSRRSKRTVEKEAPADEPDLPFDEEADMPEAVAEKVTPKEETGTTSRRRRRDRSKA